MKERFVVRQAEKVLGPWGYTVAHVALPTPLTIETDLLRLKDKKGSMIVKTAKSLAAAGSAVEAYGLYHASTKNIPLGLGVYAVGRLINMVSRPILDNVYVDRKAAEIVAKFHQREQASSN